MASKLKHIRSSVPGRVPTDSQIETGQIAINTADGKIFTKKENGEIVALQAVDPDFASSSIFQGDTLLKVLDAQDSTKASITASIDGVSKVVIEADGTEFNGPITVNAAETLFFNDADDNKYVGIQAPDDVNFSYIIKLPPEDSIDPAVLTTDGQGNTFWGRPDAFGGNRVYVSDKYGNDENDGTSQPVKSITRATQIAADLSYRPKVDPGREFFNAKKLLRDNKPYIKEEAIAFIEANFVNFFPEFDQTDFGNDVVKLIDAVTDDIVFGTNYKSTVLALELAEKQKGFATDGQKAKYIDFVEYVLTRIELIAPLDAATLPAIRTLWASIVEIIWTDLDDAQAMSEIYFTANPTAIVTLTNGVDLLRRNKEFIAEEQIAWIEAEILSGNSPYNNGLTYSQAVWKDFYNDLIDAIAYDLQYGGNTATIAQTDWLSYGDDNITGVEPQYREAITHLSTYIDDVIESNTISAPVQSTVAQVTDAANGSGVESTAAIALLTQLNERTYQDDSNYPVIITGQSYVAGFNFDPGNTDRGTIRDETAAVRQNSIIYLDQKYPGAYKEAKCRRDTGLITEAAYWDILLGTNYNQITAGLSYTRGTSAYLGNYQNIQTVESLKHAKTLATVLTNTDAVAQFRNDEAWDEVVYIIENGVTEDGSTRPVQYPSPVGVSEFKVEAKDVIQDKRILIQNRAISWLALNYPELVYDSAKCRRDVGYVLDALCYDITYGGNSATHYNASIYYENAVNQLPPEQRVVTSALYAELKNWVEGAIAGTDFTEAIDEEGNPVVVDPTTGTGPTGTPTSGTGTGGGTTPGTGTGGGTPTSAPPTGGPTGTEPTGEPPEELDPLLIVEIQNLQALIDVIIDVIDQGVSQLPNKINPDIAWVSAPITTAATNLLNGTAGIQQSVIEYIENNFTGYVYDTADFTSKLGALIDAAELDVGLSTNYNAVAAGRAYNIVDAPNVFIDQLREFLLTITDLKARALLVSDVGDFPAATTSVTNTFDEIINIISNGNDSASALTFTSPTGATDTEYAKDHLQLNREFLQDEVIAWLNVNYGSLRYVPRKTKERVGFVVDALSYDILYGGNSATRFAAAAYFFGTINGLTGAEANATSAAYNRLQTVVAQVVRGITVSKSAGNTQVQDTSTSNADEATGILVQDLVQIVEDTITNGDLSALPAAIDPSTAWNVSDLVDAATGLNSTQSAMITESIFYLNTITFDYNRDTCKRDIGLIVDAVAYDIVLGGNQKSVEGGLSYLSIAKVMKQQLFQTLKSIQFTRDLCVDGILTNTAYTPTYTNVAPFQKLYTNLSTASAAATVRERFDELLLVLTRPAKTAPELVGVSTKLNTYNALQNAKGVIQTATTRFIKGSFSGFIYNVATCERDIGLIIDAVCYDLITGSYFASAVAGRSYARGTASVVNADQKEETIAAFGYAKGLSLEYADSIEQAEIALLWDIVIDLISTGVTDKGNIWNNFTYNSVKCARDTEYLVDAVRLDAIFNSNYRSIASAKRYLSGTASVVTTSQKPQTAASFGQAKVLTAAILSDATLISRSNALWDEIIDIVSNGENAVDAYSYPTPTGGASNASDAGYLNAATQLIANKLFMQKEISAWIAGQIGASQPPFASDFVYDEEKCERDIGLLIDALVYDLTYGGNLQTYDAANAYYKDGVPQYGTDEKEETIAAYTRLKTIAEQVIIETAVVVSPGNLQSQDTSGTAGSTAAGNQAEALVQQLIDTLNNDGTLPVRSEPDISWTSGTFQSQYALLGTTGQQSVSGDVITWIDNNIANAFPSNNYTPADAASSVTTFQTNKATYISSVTSWIATNYPDLTYDSATCERDTGFLIDAISHDLMYNGNVQSYIAADAYYSFGVLQLGSVAEKEATVAAYTYLRNLMIADSTGVDTGTRITSLFTDVFVIINEGDIPDIVEAKFDIIPITVAVSAGDFYVNNPIIVPDFVTIVGDSIRSVVIRPLNAGKDMFRTRNGTYIFGVTFKDALDENNIPTYTFDFALAFDDPADTSVDRTDYFGIGNTKPIITTSPYIQNCSIISFLGANGAKVDGSKITTPNIPKILEEVETPVSFGDGIPEQGKSMVSNAFTTLSFGGTGWLVINDAYAQIVSCFQIFMLNGSYCQSGGYLSITNSASNFGLYALRASGYSQNAFLFDRGTIVASGFDGGNTFTSIGTGRSPIEQFVIRVRDKDDNTDITADYKQATTEVSFDATNIDAATNIITIIDHGFTNNQAVYYNSNGNDDVPGLLDQGQYYVNIIDTDTFRLFNDNSLTFATEVSPGTGTHSFTLNAEEFIVKSILNEHNNYQTLVLTDGQNLSINSFNTGDALLGTTASFENTAFVLDWDHLTRTLIVSNEGTNVGADEPITVRFEDTSTITQVAGALISPAYTIESAVARTDYWTATFTVDSTVPDNTIQNPSQAVSNKISFHRPSIVNSSSHTWEYSGSGVDYNALPQNGGKSQGTDFEQYSELPGRVYASGTNELGDFKVGSFIVAENKSGEIAFNARVTVGELAVLRLSLSDVNIEEFSTDVGLGDNEIGGAQDTRVSTQLAIRSFVANRLGNVLDKNVSSNAVPGAVVQLNSAGQINADLLPPARGITTYNVDGWEGRLRLSQRVPPVEVIAGDNASETYDQAILVVTNNVTANKGDEITQVGNAGAFGYNQNTIINNTVITLADVTGTFNTTGELEVNGVAQSGVIPSTVNATEEIVDNYFMKSDTISQYLVLEGGVTYDFTGITEVIGANAGAQGDITAGPTYGNIASLNYATFTPGTGYTPGTGTATYKDIPLTGGTGTGAIGDVIVTGGVVESVQLTSSGVNYTAGDTLSAVASGIGGTGSGFAINVATVQTRLFIDLSGGFTKFSANEGSPDYIQDANANVKTIADVTATTNVIVNGADIGAGGDIDYLNSEFEVTGHGLVSGEAVKYSRNGNPVIGNLVDDETYFVKVIDSNVFELYANYAFTSGSQILLGGSTSGNHVFAHDVISIDNDIFNIPAHTFATGDIVRLSATDAPAGLLDQTTYFIGSVTTNTFTLHEQGGDALASTNGVTLNAIDLTDTGTGSLTLTLQNVAIVGTVNTSSTTINNWGILASSSFDASAIVSGVIDPSRLAPEGSATDQSFLRLLNGNSAWVLAVQNIRPTADSPISVTGDFFTDPSDGFNKYYAELALDVSRADDTGGDTNYTNLGVVGTNKLQFTTTSGQVSIKSGVVDAGFLGGQAGNYYTNPANLSSSVGTNKGGTGLASYTAGDMIYSGATDSLTNLSIGPNNSVLFSDGAVPQWTTSPTFGGALTIGGIAAVNSTSAATSATTGALRVAGGVGIGGDVYHTGVLNTETLNVINTDPSNNVALKVRSSLQFQAVDGIQQITARMDQPAGGLRFDGAAGQLFTITDTLVGTVFSVNNDTKTLLEGNDVNELIAVPASNSYLLVGQTSNDGVSRLQVTGQSVFTGNVNISGTMTAASKSFLINHPNKPGYKLQYGSLESPYHGVRLTGEGVVKNGTATIELPDYINALCREEGVNVQLTNIKHGQVLWVESVDIANNQVEVKTENTDGNFKFYWSFTAVRKDVPPLATEYKY